MNHYYTKFMNQDEEISGISQDPVNILFNPSVISKKDVWQINLIEILKLLVKILEQTGKKDLKVAGMAALSSSLIYRMKVESIFALQKAAMEKKPLINRRDVDIDIIDMPYRHESTYPVSLDELLDLLENLIGSIANPRSRRRGQLDFDTEPPDFKKYLLPFENLVGKYEDLIVRKIRGTGNGLLKDIVIDLDSLDSVRCFFAILFLARDKKVELDQIDDDIQVTLIDDTIKKEKNMIKIQNENEIAARLESALYSAGRPLTIEELIKATGTESRQKTLTVLDLIIKKMKNTFKAIEIVILPDDSYVFQLKPEYSSSVRKYASKPLLSRATQKTLSYIALEQPISSKQLLEVRGSGVYGQLKELRQLNFIEHQSIGRLRIYSTTEKFQKYFGIEGGIDMLKQKLFKRVKKESKIVSQ